MLRRSLLRLAGGLLMLAAPVLATCSPDALPDAPPTPVPIVPFTDVVVTEVGGVDGRYNVLLIKTDGVALLMGREPSAGQIDETDLSRLRTLLESEQFRREVAADDIPRTPAVFGPDHVDGGDGVTADEPDRPVPQRE